MTSVPNAREFALPDMWHVPFEMGFSVIPVPRDRKRPTMAWKVFQTERAAEEQVRRWASQTSNIAIVTGAVSGCFVLDLDDANAIAEAERRGLPDTVSVTTPRGRHVYFRHPGYELRNGAGVFPGADIRGDGGFVIAPGSHFIPDDKEQADGKVEGFYSWENPPGLFELADAPEWLLQLLAGGAAIEREARKVRRAAKGTRNDELNRAAFKLGQDASAGRVNPDEARERLRRAANDAGLDSEEVEATIASGLGAGRRKPKQDEPSEDDVALAFTDRFRDMLRFDHDLDLWLEWDGRRWRPDTRHRAFTYARVLARQNGAAGKANFAAGVERFARADPAHAVNADTWDADAMLLGTPGGTVDLRTGKLKAARPDSYITKLAGCAPESGEPKLWLRFLKEALDGDDEAIRFLKLWAGYCLTGDTREHALIFLHGLAGTGKSVFLNTLAAILGDYAVTAAMETFTASKYDRHSTELAMLRGARLVTASETEEGRAWAEARIKQITGGDPITARFMRQDNFTFRPQFKLTIVGNHAPRLTNPDDAMRRRFNILGFNVKPECPDLQLEERLRREHGRILAWAIEGCLEWQAGGLVRPAAVQDATTEYFAGEDLMGQWLADRCTMRHGAFELPATLYRDRQSYAQANGEDPGTSNSFGKKMSKRSIPAKVSNGIRAHRGIELRQRVGAADAD